jgi:ethanolamine transporter EutH
MKKNVLVFGLISGLIVSGLMILFTSMHYNNPDFEGSMLLGYASMILSFSFIFVGIKNYRDKYNEGFISFGKAFKIGILIALISSTCYVLTWLVEYYFFIPDFMEKYTEHMMLEAEKSGISGLELDKKAEEMATYKEMYKNPVFVVLLTYLEVLPVGLIISLIAALILKKKPKVAASY